MSARLRGCKAAMQGCDARLGIMNAGRAGITNNDGRSGHSAVECHACALVSVRGTVNGVKREPVLACDTGVGRLKVVVGVGVEVTPAAARSGGVLASFCLTGHHNMLVQALRQTMNVGRGAHGQCQDGRNERLHCEGLQILRNDWIV